MTPRLHARLSMYALLWRAAMSHADQGSSSVIRWGGLFLASIACLLAWHSAGLRGLGTLAWCVAFGAILVMWMTRFIPGAAKLNSPANAKLVPQMRRRLLELACIVWLIGVAGIAAAPLANPTILGVILLIVVVVTLGSAFSAAGHQAGTAVLTTTCIGSALIGQVPPAVLEGLSRPPFLALAVLLYAGLILVSAREIFPEGGERHWNMVARRARVADAAGKKDLMVEQVAGRQATRWYAASLGRASNRRDTRRLVLHGLGPGHHLGELVVALGLLSCVLLAVGLFATWRAGVGADTVGGIGWLFACLLLFVPFSTIVRLDAQVAAHPGEQALLRLAPAMPGAAPAFNRHLGRALLRQASMAWAAASSAALALTALGGASAATLVNLACACCLLLPLVAAPLRNHAQRAPAAPMLVVIVLLVSAGADILLGFAARRAGLPVLPVAAVLSIATAVIAVRRGLRVMEASPFAFPAGRMD
jgi:hypothetical protein